MPKALRMLHNIEEKEGNHLAPKPLTVDLPTVSKPEINKTKKPH
jgi:hypothetical protein